MDVAPLQEGTLAAGLVAVPLGVAIAAATGFRVFLPLLALGLAGRFELVPLADGFRWLADTGTLLALGVAAVVEVAAYYVPGLDHLLDVLAGPAALAAGALGVAAVTVNLPPSVRWPLAIVAGSGSAGLVQGATTLLRAKSGLFTGGLANPVVATGELGGALLFSALALLAPVLAVVALVAAGAFLFAARRRARRTAVPGTVARPR
jgi:hypothetical protein